MDPEPDLRSRYADACSIMVNVRKLASLSVFSLLIFRYIGRGRTNWNSDGKDGLACLLPAAFNTVEEVNTAISVQSST